MHDGGVGFFSGLADDLARSSLSYRRIVNRIRRSFHDVSRLEGKTARWNVIVQES